MAFEAKQESIPRTAEAFKSDSSLPTFTRSSLTPDDIVLAKTNKNQLTIITSLFHSKIHAIARNLARNPKIDWDDLYQTGMLALIRYIGKYDPESHRDFETAAIMRIRGAMLDEMRSMSPFTRSGYGFLQSKIAHADALGNELGRKPNPVEIARSMNISIEKLDKTMCSISGIFSISDNGDKAQQDKGSNLSIYDSYISTLDTESMRQFRSVKIKIPFDELIVTLEPRDQTIARLYYMDQLTMQEIGIIIGLSEGSISIRLKKVYQILRQDFAALAA